MNITIDYFKNFPTRLFILLCLALLFLPFAIKSDVSGQRRRPVAGSSGADTGLVFRLSEAQDEQQRPAQERLARTATEPLPHEAAPEGRARQAGDRAALRRGDSEPAKTIAADQGRRR